MHISSSWNAERVAACLSNKPHKARQVPASRYVASRRGGEITVYGPRKGKRFVVIVDGEVSSALVRDDTLVVEFANGSCSTYSVKTGKQLSESRPKPPVGGLGPAVRNEAA